MIGIGANRFIGNSQSPIGNSRSPVGNP